jgi:hypothetical protein
LYYEINTFFTLSTSKTSPVLKSFNHPFSSPLLLLYSTNLLSPYTYPFGSNTKSLSTWLLVWWAYGTFRASSLSSVEHIGHIEVVREEQDVGEIVVCGRELWHEGVLRAERPAESAMCSSGTEGSERSVLWVWEKRVARVVQRVGE